eukprot:1068656-Pyramimonas_sp.AAC.1
MALRERIRLKECPAHDHHRRLHRWVIVCNLLDTALSERASLRGGSYVATGVMRRPGRLGLECARPCSP